MAFSIVITDVCSFQTFIDVLMSWEGEGAESYQVYTNMNIMILLQNSLIQSVPLLEQPELQNTHWQLPKVSTHTELGPQIAGSRSHSSISDLKSVGRFRYRHLIPCMDNNIFYLYSLVRHHKTQFYTYSYSLQHENLHSDHSYLLLEYTNHHLVRKLKKK